MTTTQTTSAGSAGLMWAATIEAPSSGWAATRKAIDRDAALVERLRREDAGSVEALVRAYGDRVYRLAMRITGNVSDAEEVVQDALWTASRKIDTSCVARTARARAMRCRTTNRWGGTPVLHLKSRAKW